MKHRKYLPLVIVLALLAVFVAGRAVVQQDPSPYQAQVDTEGASLDEVEWLELDIELFDGTEIDMEYDSTGDEPTATITRWTADGEENQTGGQEAIDQVNTIVQQLPRLENAEPLPMIQTVLDQLQVGQNDVAEFEFEYRSVDGAPRSIELEVDPGDGKGENETDGG